jgi:hypothetical protein
MQKFMCAHTFPSGAFTEEQIRGLAEAAQHDPAVRGYRCFFNLSEGRVFCILEAHDREAVTNWFKKMNIPYDDVVPVEYEGERGTVEAVYEEPVLAGAI